jgi:hypothetical protein
MIASRRLTAIAVQLPVGQGVTEPAALIGKLLEALPNGRIGAGLAVILEARPIHPDQPAGPALRVAVIGDHALYRCKPR